jgi:hypothetical protein
MDELDVIRDVLAGPPPPPQATFQARNRLTAAMESPAPGPRRKRALGWSLGGGAAVAGALAAVLVVPMGSGGGLSASPPAGGAGQAPVALSAHDILLAAASRAERAPATTGRFWHVRTVGVGGPYRVGTAPNQYDLVGRELTETWMARNPADRNWQGYRQLGFHPRSAADERAWRAAGSPDHWDIATDSISGTRRLTAAPSAPALSPDDQTVPFLDDLGGFDVAGLNALPQDPARLRALFAARIASHLGQRAGSPEGNLILFIRLSQLLLETPAPPKVRAAAFTAIAAIPGVHSVGTVTAANGRSGLGIELDRTSGGIRELNKIVIDPSTYLVLGQDYVAAAAGKSGGRPVKESNSVVVTAEWTDRTPTPPAD